MSDIWRWIQDKHYEAMHEGNETKIQMVELFWKTLNTMEDDPQTALNYISQSRHLAKILDEKWFIQLLNHWELQARFAFLGDYNGTLELATKATVEVRLPEYQALPQRICLHEDLISAYVQQDPIGNKDLIQKALDYMEDEVDRNVECFICLNSLKLNFARTTGTSEDAVRAGLNALSVAEGSPHHLTHVYTVLVESAYELKQWDKLLLWIIEAESNARKSDRDNYVATTLVWLAFHSQRTGDETRATSLFQQGVHRANRYGAFLGKPFYTASTAYHESGGRLQEALDAQTTYLRQVVGKAKPFSESLARIEIIRLKKAMEQPYDDDITHLKETVKALKAPDYMLDKLKVVLEK